MRPGGTASRDLEEEPPEQFLAALGMYDLWVELDAVKSAGRVLERSHGNLGRGGCHAEAWRRLDNRVGVAHPHLARRFPSVHENRVRACLKRRATELALFCPPHLASEELDEQLGSITDAEQGNS